MKKIIHEPLGHRILLRLDREKDGKKPDNKIVLLEQTKNREVISSGVGTVVAIGCTAFYDYADRRPWCEVGDRIHYVRHTGTLIGDYQDEDGYKYRAINDVDAFVREKEVEVDE